MVLSNGFPNVKSYVKCGGTGAKLEGVACLKVMSKLVMDFYTFIYIPIFGPK